MKGDKTLRLGDLTNWQSRILAKTRLNRPKTEIKA